MTDISQLLREQAQAMGMSAVPLVPEGDGMASTDGNAVFYNPSFMSDIESTAGEAGLRFILAHELGHIHNGMTGGHRGELEADAFAARSLATLGYGTDSIDGVAAHLNTSATATHPSAAVRASAAKSAHSTAESKTAGRASKPSKTPRAAAIDI